MRSAPDLPDRYQILRPLGAGAFGTVFHALDQELEREVAIKVLHRAGAQTPEGKRFAREAQVLASVRHPNLFQVYEVGTTAQDHPYATFEYIPGLDLRAYLTQKGEIAPEHWLPILKGSLAGLRALHEAGVLHRDLKTENILLAPDGTPRLVDLGLVLSAQHLTRITEEDCLVGTPQAMAPEILAGEPASPVSDLYALGTVAFRLIYGEPFRPETRVVEFLRIPKLTPQEFFPSDRLGRFPDWDPWLRRMLRMNPAGRPQSCQEAIELLPKVASALSGPLPTPSREHEVTEKLPRGPSREAAASPAPKRRGKYSRRKSSRRRRRRLALALGTLGLGAIGVWQLKNRLSRKPKQPPPEASFHVLEEERRKAEELLIQAADRLPFPPIRVDLERSVAALRPFQEANLPAKVQRYLECLQRLQDLGPPAEPSPLRSEVQRVREELSYSYPYRYRNFIVDAARLPLGQAGKAREISIEVEKVLAQDRAIVEVLRQHFLGSSDRFEASSRWLEPENVLLTLSWSLIARLKVPDSALDSAARRVRESQFASEETQAWNYIVGNYFELGLSESATIRTTLGLLEWSAAHAKEPAYPGGPDQSTFFLLPTTWSLLALISEPRQQAQILEHVRPLTRALLLQGARSSPKVQELQEHLKGFLNQTWRRDTFGLPVSRLSPEFEAFTQELRGLLEAKEPPKPEYPKPLPRGEEPSSMPPPARRIGGPDAP